MMMAMVILMLMMMTVIIMMMEMLMNVIFIGYLNHAWNPRFFVVRNPPSKKNYALESGMEIRGIADRYEMLEDSISSFLAW